MQCSMKVKYVHRTYVLGVWKSTMTKVVWVWKSTMRTIVGSQPTYTPTPTGVPIRERMSGPDGRAESTNGWRATRVSSIDQPAHSPSYSNHHHHPSLAIRPCDLSFLCINVSRHVALSHSHAPPSSQSLILLISPSIRNDNPI